MPAFLSVSEEELDELRDRLRRTRWPTPWPMSGWDAGTDVVELRRLVEYWAGDYDWRAHERAMAELPSFVASIGGADVQYLRFDGERPDALPIVVTHGWPSSFLELVSLAHRLASPSRYRGDPADSFTVIVPSLPGFGLSAQRPSLPADLGTHEIWHRLMRDELGFFRYGAHGGDLGAGVTSLLGQTYPDEVVGIHLLAVASPPDVDLASLTAQEQVYRDGENDWFERDGAYEHQQMTEPMTLGFGLSDSPAGLLGWLLGKYRTWTDSAGDLSTRMSDDFVLTQASLYWFTSSIATSFRPYYEFNAGMTTRVRRVDVPTAVAVFPYDLSQPPRSWAERMYNVTRYTTMPRGGHFAAHEEPDLLAADLRDFFRELR